MRHYDLEVEALALRKNCDLEVEALTGENYDLEVDAHRVTKMTTSK